MPAGLRVRSSIRPLRGSRRWPALAVLLALAGCTPAAPVGGPTQVVSSPQASVSSSPEPTPISEETTSPDESAPASFQLTVMTYNTLTGRNDCAGCAALRKAGLGDELALDARMPKVAEKIVLAAPDIVGFQENEGSSPLPQEHLAGLLAGYSWIEPGASVPIAVRSDRFEVRESGVDTLEDGPVACTPQDRTTGRYVVWANLHDRATDRDLWVFNTHLHPYDKRACAKLRAKDVAAMATLIRQKDPGLAVPAIVTGDFNSYGAEQRAGFRDHLDEMASLGFVDSHAVAERDDSDVPGAASAGFLTAKVKGKSYPKVIRVDGSYLDFVWVPRQSTVRSWQVMSGPGVAYRKIRGQRVPYWTDVVGSDHSPVIVTVQLP